MSPRETRLRELAEQPREALLEQVLRLEEQKLALEQRLRQKEEQLTEAQAFIAELKRQLFGSKAEKLSPAQEAQVEQIVDDLREQGQRPEPVVQQVLQEEQKTQRQRRPPSHPLPIELETETVILEPEIRSCACCGPLP